jgi:urease accessory protein
MSWLVLQLADAAFPAGGFAHSAGLEAARQLGETTTRARLESFVHESLWQAGYASLPLVLAAHDEPDAFARPDALADVVLTSAVAHRASRAQGRALLAASVRIFDEPRIARLDADVRAKKTPGHLAPLFGAVVATLGVSRDDAARLFLHLALRSVTSAAVRLGLVGAHEGQSLHHDAAPLLDAVLAACARLGVEEIAQTAPIVEIVGAQHDALYSRLFQS